MKYLPGDLVTQGLCGDDGNFLAYPLVGMEIQRQSSIVLLDDDSGGFFDSLRPDTTLNNNGYPLLCTIENKVV